MNRFVFLLLVSLSLLSYIDTKTTCFSSRKKLLTQMEKRENIYKALTVYNKTLHSHLRKLVEQTQLELISDNVYMPKDVKMTYYFLGSLARKTALPFSDLEFGIIVSERSLEVKKYVNDFMQTFYQKLNKAGYYLDENGWYPPFQRKDRLNGKKIFLATPDELKKFIKKGKNHRVRVALLQRHFFYGDKQLYKECLEDEEHEDLRKSLKEEFFVMKKHLNTNVKTMSKVLQEEKFNKSQTFNFKSYLIQPVEMLIFYLGQWHHISNKSIFHMIEKLAIENHISQSQKQKLIKALSFGIKKRLFYEDQSVLISSLSQEEIASINNHLSFIFSFLSHVESSL